jgi:hypothetical protein
MTWGSYLLQLLAAGALFAGVVTVALAMGGRAGWACAAAVGTLLLALLTPLHGPVPTVLIQLGSLIAGAMAAAAVVRALHARRPLLLAWLAGTTTFVALWVAAAYGIHAVV